MIKQFEIGAKVAVLDEAFEGVVTKISKNEITIETTDGFLMTYQTHELITLNGSKSVNHFDVKFNLDQIIKEKSDPKLRSFVKEKKSKYEIGVPEFDLHIEKLVPNKRGMSNYDILTLQTETAKRHIEFAIRNRIPKIVFIHGVGEGVLKAELDFLLGRYEQLLFQDANYQRYGLGATEVLIRQSKM